MWVAVRTCFNPLPPIESFTAYRDSSNRWLVEGRSETTSSLGRTDIITFGLWVVDVSNGAIAAYDRLATLTTGKTFCYQEP